MLKKGDKVTGNLFEKGTVIEVGPSADLFRYDSSGAVADAIATGLMDSEQEAVAVELPDGSMAVYDAEEVFPAR